MLRSKSLLAILIVFVLPIFFVQSMSYAHPDEGDIDDEKEALERTIDDMDRAEERWENIKNDLQQLISEWSSNKDKIERGEKAALTRFSIAIVSGAAAAASGGFLVPAAYISISWFLGCS